jgi:PhnB protein
MAAAGWDGAQDLLDGVLVKPQLTLFGFWALVGGLLIAVGLFTRFVAFIAARAAFGAIEVYRIEDPGGSVVARLSVAGAEFWLSDESPEHGNFSPQSLGGATARMILTVPDPDAMFRKAVAAGAREVVAVQEAHGWRLGRVVDPFGHHWEIGHPLPA